MLFCTDALSLWVIISCSEAEMEACADSRSVTHVYKRLKSFLVLYFQPGEELACVNGSKVPSQNAKVDFFFSFYSSMGLRGKFQEKRIKRISHSSYWFSMAA